MNKIKSYYWYIGVPIVALIFGTVLCFELIASTVRGNPHPQINYVIFVLIAGGCAMMLQQVLRMNRDARYIEAYYDLARNRMDATQLRAQLDSQRSDARAVLEIVNDLLGKTVSPVQHAALEAELHRYKAKQSRYLILPQFMSGMMVGLGLFGTFIGLLGALAEIGKLIGAFSLATGGSDPSEAIRMLVERDLPLQLWALIDTAYLIPGFKDVLDYEKIRQLRQFMYERLAVNLREQGYTAQEVDAVLANQPQQLSLVPKYLAAVRAFAALPEAPALAAANKRVTNILKKAGEVDAHVNPELLQEQAEKDLYAALQRFVPEANAQFDAGDYTASLQTLAVLRAPVDAFFDDVMVNAEQLDLRLNRLGLLKSLHEAMNRVADLSRLAA